MVWISDINDLQYYHPVPDVPCYCEHLVYPSDLVLQGVMNTLAPSTFVMRVYVYSADGVTQYENATNNFEFYYFTYNGQRYFNLRLKSFSAAMCAHKCYILRVWVSRTGGRVTQTVFDKFTERYCQADCCDIPRDVSIVPSGGTGLPPSTRPTTGTTAVIPTSECGFPLIRITSHFDCIDKANGDFYGIPDVVLDGDATFSFTKITNISGKIKQRPREIKREVSYNCKLQKVESFRPYFIESFEMFPTWKLDEIEGMFQSNHIYVSDFGAAIGEKEYQFAGGTVTKQPYTCWEMFKLEATLQDCTHRQIYGCSDDCSDNSNAMLFAIPPQYADSVFYSESRQLIGNWQALEIYLAGQSGITDVADVTDDYINYFAVLRVQGTGYIPTSIYANKPLPRNKIFAVRSIPDEYKVASAPPIIGAVTVVDMTCAPPIPGAVTVIPMPEVNANVNDYENWIIQSDTLVVSERLAFLNMVSRNTTVVFEGPDDHTYWASEIIGLISVEGHPSSPVRITHDDNENIPVGNYLTIDTNGLIRWSGVATNETGAFVEIELVNIYYNL